MPDMTAVPFVLAMAQPGPNSPSIWVQLFPFALMLGIFYLLVLMPMKKRQKRVQAFQAALKVGDRVITTSGIHGQVTRLSETSVQIQIADKVRVEMARSAIGGYQGQEPVVQESGTL
jgi:preprotein translocase subunit YajC